MRTLSAVLLALAVFAGLGVVWARRFGGFAPEPFRNRSCQGRAWKRAFPTASRLEIRDFLNIFTESFAFHSTERLRFAPEDCILAVYRSIYPRTHGIDGLELETLVLQTERRFGLKLAQAWSDRLTLGELFTLCMQASRRRQK